MKWFNIPTFWPIVFWAITFGNIIFWEESGITPTQDFLLQEDGSFLLLEDWSKILLETN